MTATFKDLALNGKRILLIIGGGIAAYKCLELIRLISKAGGKTRCVLTKAAEVHPTEFANAIAEAFVFSMAQPIPPPLRRTT